MFTASLEQAMLRADVGLGRMTMHSPGLVLLARPAVRSAKCTLGESFWPFGICSMGRNGSDDHFSFNDKQEEGSCQLLANNVSRVEVRVKPVENTLRFGHRVP